MKDDGTLPESENVQRRKLRAKAFGDRLAALLLKRGMTQSELARAIDVGRDSISGYVRGHNIPTPQVARRIASVLLVTLEDMFPIELAALPGPAEKQRFAFNTVAGRSGLAVIQMEMTLPFNVAAEIARLVAPYEVEAP
jgi:transcriptional regulator with XRE-family HTH domain